MTMPGQTDGLMGVSSEEVANSRGWALGSKGEWVSVGKERAGL